MRTSASSRIASTASRRGPSGAPTHVSRKNTRPRYEQALVSQRKQGVPEGTRCAPQGGAGAGRPRERARGETPDAAAGRRAQGRLRLPVGERREGGEAREV